MDAELRRALTAELSKLSGAMAADLRARMLAPGVVQDRARQLHADEQVGEAFELWTDLLARRAAVLWILKSVYVRVLEDRGLCRPLRIVDRGSQDLFERLAPSLGETAYLKWIYRDLGVEDGALPELFASQPAEIALPSNDLSKSLLELWRRRDQETGKLVYSFAQEHFDGRLMGDLYQDLDPVVKKRFALLQTPDFIVDFILGETLTPALAEYGVDTVRVLDPSCGSGHFLLAAFKRLVGAMRERHQERPVRDVVADVLGRVVGVDLNDYACGLARARLVMTALELSGETRLEAAAGFHPQVFCADALEQVERTLPEQMTLPTMGAEAPKPTATMTRPEVRAALRPVLRQGFHVIVGNPPYITEKDKAKKDYHCQLVIKKEKRRRYVSASGRYSLAAPFMERMLQLSVDGGFTGQITTNALLKREFGKALIEEVLASADLCKVVDTSGAYVPGHGTPTVMLFARRRAPAGDGVPVVMGKRGEPGRPEDPAKGKVWSSIAEGHATIGYENEFVSVSLVSRATLSRHPWSIGGGGAAELKDKLETAAASSLATVAASIGFDTITRASDLLELPLRQYGRARVERTVLVDYVAGEDLRDWAVQPDVVIPVPYNPDTWTLASIASLPGLETFLWPHRYWLSQRWVSGGTRLVDVGLPYWAIPQFPAERRRVPLSIAFAFKATHNHFVLDRGGKAFNRTAPVIKLPAGASIDEHLALLAQLNSSTGCFWMKQVCQTTGGPGGGKTSENDYENFYEHDGTKLQSFPLAATRNAALEAFASLLDELARQRVDDSVRAIIGAHAALGAKALRAALDERRQRDLNRLFQMVGLQEELDWLCYELYGIDADVEVRAPGEVHPLVPGQRPFELVLARDDAERREALARGEEPDEAPTAWFERHGWEPVTSLDAIADKNQRTLITARIERTAASKWLGLVEQPTYKRRWYRPKHEEQEQEALATWLADRIEDWSKSRERPFTVKEAALALETDPAVLAVAELLAGRSTFDLVALVRDRMLAESVPSCKVHVYSEEGLRKRALWEETWEMQRREDAGEKVTPAVPPKYGQGDFLRSEYWKLRGKLDVPKERWIALSEVPGRANGDVLYGWAGWTPRQRAKVLLVLDEELENEGVVLADRHGILHGVGFLLPYVEWESPKAAAEFRAVVTSLVGQEGVTDEMLRQWAEIHGPPGARARGPGRAAKGARTGRGSPPSEGTTGHQGPEPTGAPSRRRSRQKASS